MPPATRPPPSICPATLASGRYGEFSGSSASAPCPPSEAPVPTAALPAAPSPVRSSPASGPAGPPSICTVAPPRLSGAPEGAGTPMPRAISARAPRYGATMSAAAVPTFRATASGTVLTPTLRGSAPSSPNAALSQSEPPTGFSTIGRGAGGCGTFAIDGGTESLVSGPNSSPAVPVKGDAIRLISHAAASTGAPRAPATASFAPAARLRRRPPCLAGGSALPRDDAAICCGASASCAHQFPASPEADAAGGAPVPATTGSAVHQSAVTAPSAGIVHIADQAV